MVEMTDWLPDIGDVFYGTDRRPVLGPHKIKRTWLERIRSNPFQKYKDINRLPYFSKADADEVVKEGRMKINGEW